MIHLIGLFRRLMWENLEAVQTKRKTVNIRDLTSEVGQERLETRDRVTKLQLGYNYLVVATTKQFYIFREVLLKIRQKFFNFHISYFIDFLILIGIFLVHEIGIHL